MQEVILATGNAVKFHAAQTACSQFGITLIQHPLDVPEIQGEDGEIIACDKAEKAFAVFQNPFLHVTIFGWYQDLTIFQVRT